MNAPWCHRLGFILCPASRCHPLIECPLRMAPPAKATLTFPEYEIAIESPRLGRDDRPCRIGQRQDMQTAIFSAVRRKAQHTVGYVHLRPFKVADLFAPLAGKDQQPDDVSKLDIAKSAPNLPQLIVTQDTIPRLGFGRPIRTNDRVAFGKALTHCPCEEHREPRPRPISSYRAMLIGKLRQASGDCPAPNRDDRKAVEWLKVPQQISL